MTWKPGAKAATTILALLAASGTAHAQRATENAVTDADDAFGTSVGLETTGIYTENDTRGFSPLKAGNVRIDGIYFDPVVALSGRVRQSTAIRVGFSAVSFPFVAPTGVVDHNFRPFPEKFGNSVSASYYGFGGVIVDWDLRLPLVKGHVGLTGGLAFADVQSTDGSNNKSWGWTVRPIIRVAGAEIAPFAAVGRTADSLSHPLVVVNGPYLPGLPPKRLYLGQKWAEIRNHNENYGITLKAPVTDSFSVRAGLFHAVGNRIENYSELYSITGPSGLASHRLIADPSQDVHSTSGEVLAVLRLGNDTWQHRIFGGYRARNRYTETGGSDVRDFGLVTFGDRDREPESAFAFSAVNAGRVRQSSWMFGYNATLGDLGHVNLGIQKASYRAGFRQGVTSLRTSSRDNPWLYNAMVMVHLSPAFSLYAGTERGLEDSGVAPESAANRNEQLPSTRTTQYEAGARWKFHGGQLVLNAFQITKPYFSFDAANRFVPLGSERHRGVEASLSGHFGERFSLLAGAVVMKPEVAGPAVSLGLVGKRPAGKPSLYTKLDANYRTDILGGLTAMASFAYTGRRAAGSRPQAALGGSQLMLPGYATVDVGLRRQFKIGGVSASLRAVLLNAFDAGAWKVAAANALYPEERRHLKVTLAADF